MSPVRPQRLPRTLYHYTDIYGLEGIYRSAELWATNTPYLNDTTEHQLGLAVVETRLLEQQLALMRKNRERFEAGKPDLPGLDELKMLHEVIKEARRVSDCFVLSLTQNGDQLSQWRAYAKDGYSIGFSTKALRKSLGDRFLLARVQYHEDALSARTADDSIAFAKALWRDSADWTTGTGEMLSDGARRFAVMGSITEEAAFVKDSHFYEEKEVRAVISNVAPNHFTASPRYGMTPRFKIPLVADAIESVTVGPGAHEDLRAQGLIRFVCMTPFGKAEAPSQNLPKVSKSAIPYRDW